MFQTGSWISPIQVAEYVSKNYKEVNFFYSGSSRSYSGDRSFLAFEAEKEFLEVSELREYLQKNPETFVSGYFSYELAAGGNTKTDIIPFPILHFSKLKYLIIFAHDSKEIYFNCPENIIASAKSFAQKENNETLTLASFDSNMSDAAYLQNVTKIREDIMAGDYYQANLTRKYWGIYQQQDVDHFQIFKHLSTISPAPYSSFLKYGEKAVISSSPERFINIDTTGKINVRPIKGTGKKTNSNNTAREELHLSKKDRAENLMIVDLMRNDLTRSAKSKSVKVDELFAIDSFATLNHMSSSISAEKLAELDNLEVVLRTLPPGSMTGAPKIKVVERLKEIEELPRGIYSGAIGYFNGLESCDFSVVIRTILFEKNKFSYQVGGAIIYDSVAESELAETKIKDFAIRKVLKIND